MSLNFNYKACLERKEPIVWIDDEGDERFCPWFESLIWGTLILGCQVDDRKFLPRLRQYEIALGLFCRPIKEPQRRTELLRRQMYQADTFTVDGYISAASVKRAQGLKTNASNLTDAAWVKKLGLLIAEKAASSLRCET